jgi:Pvc16 N-terminal domain
VSDYTVVAEVGEALVRVLWEEMQNSAPVNGLIDSEARISLQSPFELRDNNAVRLSVYLYRVVEDPYLKNQPMQTGPGRLLRRNPLTLDLFYLVTPLVGTPREQLIVLAKVMQVFHDRAILQGPDVGPLALADEELRVVLNPVTLEETTRVWEALQMSYRLSVCYTVRVAIVESTRSRLTQPVVDRTNSYAGS